MSTITIEKSVTINRPADEVWRFLICKGTTRQTRMGYTY